MMPDRTTIAICTCCLTLVATALFIRNRIYTAPSRPEESTEAALGIDPYLGGRITIHYHERPPYYIREESGVGGIIGERIALVFEEAGIPLTWQITPAKRQLDIIKKNEHREGAAGWFRTPDREKFAKFSLPIYRDRPTVVLTRSDQTAIQSDKPLSALLNDSRLRLLRKDGYSYGNAIDSLLERLRPAQVVTTAGNQGMLRMIYNRRADYFLIAEEEAHFLLANCGLPAEAFKIVTFSDMPNGNLRYIMFSRRVEASTIDRLNRIIQRIGLD